MTSRDDGKGFKGLSGMGNTPRPPRPAPKSPAGGPPQVPPPSHSAAPSTSTRSAESRSDHDREIGAASARGASATGAAAPSSSKESSGGLASGLVIAGVFLVFVLLVKLAKVDSSGAPPSPLPQEAMETATLVTPAELTTQMADAGAGGYANAEVAEHYPTPRIESDAYTANQPVADSDPRAAYCEAGVGGEPYSGEVLAQAATGSHSITVKAGSSAALVKLRSDGGTALAFYVRANESGSVKDLADGSYQIMFASGEGFSRKCLEFMSSMSVLADPQPVTFLTTREETYNGEVIHSSAAEYTLTEVAEGNFTPRSVDPSAFRE
jgi:hypothetical protein